METMEKFPIEAERSPLPTFRRGETASPIGEIIDGRPFRRYPLSRIFSLDLDDIKIGARYPRIVRINFLTWMGAGWRATFVFRFGYWREEIRARVSYATLRDRQRGGMRWTIGGRWREKRSSGRDNPSKPVPPSNRSKTNSVTLNWTKQRNFSLVSFTRDIVTFVRSIESSPVPRTRGTTFLNVSIG